MDNQTAKKMDKKKLIGIVVGAAVFILAFVAAQKIFFKPPTFDKQLMQIASELNESCPIMVDSETQLDNATALPGNTLQYNYTLVNMEKVSVDIASLEDYLKPIILNNIRTNPDLKTFRDNDVTMAYSYKDLNGEHLFKLIFEPSQYK